MRSTITSGLLGLGALALAVACPAPASASWLSQALHGNPIINNGGYGNYAAPGYSNNAYPYYQSQYGVPYVAPVPTNPVPIYVPAPVYAVPYRPHRSWNGYRHRANYGWNRSYPTYGLRQYRW